MSTVSYNEGASVPGIAHGIVFGTLLDKNIQGGTIIWIISMHSGWEV